MKASISIIMAIVKFSVFNFEQFNRVLLSTGTNKLNTLSTSTTDKSSCASQLNLNLDSNLNLNSNFRASAPTSCWCEQQQQQQQQADHENMRAAKLAPFPSDNQFNHHRDYLGQALFVNNQQNPCYNRNTENITGNISEQQHDLLYKRQVNNNNNNNNYHHHYNNLKLNKQVAAAAAEDNNGNHSIDVGAIAALLPNNNNNYTNSDYCSSHQTSSELEIMNYFLRTWNGTQNAQDAISSLQVSAS